VEKVLARLLQDRVVPGILHTLALPAGTTSSLVVNLRDFEVVAFEGLFLVGSYVLLCRSRAQEGSY